jgi:hypothetical protein
MDMSTSGNRLTIVAFTIDGNIADGSNPKALLGIAI